MKKINTMTRRAYISSTVYWAFFMLLWYIPTLFCPVFGLGYKKSLLILAVSVFLGLVAGTALTYRRRRNHSSVACNLITSFGVYFLMSLWAVNRTLLTYIIMIILVLCAVCCLMALIWLFCGHHRRYYLQCLYGCLMKARSISACVLAVVMLVLGIRTLLGMPLMEQLEDRFFAEAEDSGATIAGNMDALLLLQDEQWDALDASERLAVMKIIADIEANYLGIPEMNVGADVLEENTLGQYCYATNTITLNLSYLSFDDAASMLATLCHECYHAYQHRLIEAYDVLSPEYRELLIFSDTAQYKEEFRNYNDSVSSQVK